MKKTTIIVAALFFAASVFAQENKNVKWGVKGGLNLAQETVSDGETGARGGIHLGGFMETPLSKGIDFQLALLYSMQGGSYKMKSTTYTDKLDYITVPLILKIYINQKRRFTIDVGPQAGFMVSAKVSDGKSSINLYDEPELNKFEAAINIGISYKIKDNFDLVFRGTGGLTTIADNVEHKNSVLQIGIGYRF